MSVRDALSEGTRRAISRTRVTTHLPEKVVGALIEGSARSAPDLTNGYRSMSDEQARLHFGPEEPLEHEHLRRGVRYFHAWRVHTLRERIGPRLEGATFLDVGDTDGLMLKHLGKDGLGFNLSPAAVRHIKSSGVEARTGDGQDLPFRDGSFDYVLCFETLEHVESPIQLLRQLARVCRPDGRVFVSIPWVPRSFVYPRRPELPHGAGHVFELSREDFCSLVTHTPLEIRWEDRCELLGDPSTPIERAYKALTWRSHLVAGTFRRFQFFELALRA